jgi:drug/metabolite transporter (DMT)-like permease
MTQTRAMLLALTAYFLWVLVDTAIKLGGQVDVSPFVMMLLLGFVGAASLMLLARIKNKTSRLYPRSWRAQASIALCSVISNFVNIIALKHLPLTIFYIVVFTTPLVIAGFSAFMKHEVLTPIKIACLIAGFLGVVLAIGLTGSGDALGYAAGFTSVFSFAVLTILMRHISKTNSAESVAFVCALAVGTFGLLGVLAEQATMPNAWALAMIAFAGSFNAFSNVLYNRALKHTISTNVAQLHYTQIIGGAIFGYFLWHEVPTWNLIAGSILIIGSGMIVAREAHKRGKLL